MAIYMVSYDLNRQKNYTKLIGRIKQSKAYTRLLYSQWLIQDQRGLLDVANDLETYIDGDDAIMVTVFTKRTAWKNLLTNDDDMQDWIEAATP